METRTVEEYLEAIDIIGQAHSPVSTSVLADYLEVSRASVSEMLSRLAEKELIHYVPRKGASLTQTGQDQVVSLNRRHRLWEVFLHQHLNIPWEDVYREACALEHVTSELVTERLAKFLDDPQVCPHGWPIPDSRHSINDLPPTPISALDVGQSGKITYITKSWDPNLLHHLGKLGLLPGTEFKILDKSAFDGTLSIEINGQAKSLGAETATFVMVEV